MAGVGDELAHLLLAAVPDREARLDVVEQGVERGAHLAHLVALVGQSFGHPVGEVDLALGERLLGDPVGGGGDLAQRRELAAYDDVPTTAAVAMPSRVSSASAAHERLEDLARVAGGQAGHRGDAAVLGDDAVLPEPGQVDVVGVAVGGDRRQRGDDVGVEGLLRPEPPSPLSVSDPVPVVPSMTALIVPTPWPMLPGRSSSRPRDRRPARCSSAVVVEARRLRAVRQVSEARTSSSRRSSR